MRGKVLLFALGAILMLLCSCSDDCGDCPVCPEPESCSNDLYDGRLYVSELFGMMGIYVFDTATDKLVDSIVYQTSGGCVDASADGRYLLTTDATAKAMLYDASTLTLLNSIEMAGVSRFVNRDRQVMCSRLTTDFYSVPDLRLVHSDTVKLGFSEPYLESRNSFYSVWNYELLYQYSLDSFQVVRQWRPIDHEGIAYSMHCFDLSFDGCMLYMIAGSPRGSTFITYDLEADSLVREHLIYNWHGDVEANPVSGEVYVTDPAALGGFTPGTIYVFDGRTGEYLQGISLYGYLCDIEGTWDAMSARALEVTPDGSQLYVGTGHEARDQGTVLRIDTRTRRIEKLLFPNFGCWPYELAVGPKP
jgi:hypothetical protein